MRAALVRGGGQGPIRGERERERGEGGERDPKRAGRKGSPQVLQVAGLHIFGCSYLMCDGVTTRGRL